MSFAEEIQEENLSLSSPLTAPSYTIEKENVQISNTSGSVFQGSSNRPTQVSATSAGTLTLIGQGGGVTGVINNTHITSEGTLSLINTNGTTLGTGNNTLIGDRISLNATATTGYAYAITGYGKNLLSANTIEIKSSHYGLQIQADGSDEIRLSDFALCTIETESATRGFAIQNAHDTQGIHLLSKEDTYSQLHITSKENNAIVIMGNADNHMRANEIHISGKDQAVYLHKGSLSLEASDLLRITDLGNTTSNPGLTAAIYVDNTGALTINQRPEGTLQVNGNVFAYTSQDFSLSFNTDQSYLHGIVIAENENHHLLFQNGAIWNHEIYPVQETNQERLDSLETHVKNVTFLNGTLQQKSDIPIYIETYTGIGEINFQGTNVENSLQINTGKVHIQNATNNSVVILGLTGVSGIDTTEEEKVHHTLQTIAQQVIFPNASQSETPLQGLISVKEGILSSSITAEVDFTLTEDNSGSIVIDTIQTGSKETATMDHMKAIANTALLAWRQEDSTLSQRLGDFRNTKGDQGFWTRMSRGEFTYESQLKNQYNYFQLGYDKAYKNWHYGFAVSHNDGQTTYDSGYGDNSSLSLSLYGTWLGNDGLYGDLVLKEGRLRNSFTNYAEAGITSGSYSLWGTALSGEIGKRHPLSHGWSITPIIQLTYMYLNQTDYTASVTTSEKTLPLFVRQGSMQSLVGRLGVEVRKTCSENSSFYFQTSLFHEFDGTATTHLWMDGLQNQYDQDLSETWYACSLGLQYNLTPNTYVYADVSKTFSASIATPWQWNGGIRIGF